MLEFQQSESIAERRRWIIVLVDSTDGVSGKTGQTGQVYVSKNGGTPALSTNSIVEVDATNMPGHYYIELVAGELSTLGFISITKKNASTLAFHDRALVSYNNPYVTQGGFTAASIPGGVTKTQAKALLEDIRKIVQEELAAAEQDEYPEYDDTTLQKKLDLILDDINQEQEPDEIDFSPVFDAIRPVVSAIKALPVPKDYLSDFNNVVEAVNAVKKLQEQMDIPGVIQAVTDFQAKLQLAEKEIDGSLDEVDKIKAGFAALQEMVNRFKDTLNEQSDLDRRFAAINGKMKDGALADIEKKVVEIGKSVINAKFDILKELSSKR